MFVEQPQGGSLQNSCSASLFGALDFIFSEAGGLQYAQNELICEYFFGDFDQVAVQLRCVTALCGTPSFVEYHLIIASSDSIFVSSVSKDFRFQIFLLLIFLNEDFNNKSSHRAESVLFYGNNTNIRTVIDSSKLGVYVFEKGCGEFHFQCSCRPTVFSFAGE